RDRHERHYHRWRSNSLRHACCVYPSEASDSRTGDGCALSYLRYWVQDFVGTSAIVDREALKVEDPNGNRRAYRDVQSNRRRPELRFYGNEGTYRQRAVHD